MLITCETCNNKYSTEEYDNCPSCGDDNAGQVEDLKNEEE